MAGEADDKAIQLSRCADFSLGGTAPPLAGEADNKAIQLAIEERCAVRRLCRNSTKHVSGRDVKMERSKWKGVRWLMKSPFTYDTVTKQGLRS